MSKSQRIETYKMLHKNPITPLIGCDFDHKQFIKEYTEYEAMETEYPGTNGGSSLCLTSTDGGFEGERDELGNPHGKDYNFLKSNVPTEIFKLPSLNSLHTAFDYGRSVITTLPKGGFFPSHRDIYFPNMLKILAITCEPEDYILRFDNRREFVWPGRFFLIDSTILHEVYAKEKVHQFIIVIRMNKKNIDNLMVSVL